MYSLGFDIGSSSIKAALLDVATGERKAAVTVPSEEMPIDAPHAGWAEQDPAMWWKYAKQAVAGLLNDAGVKKEEIKSIGISYQMHGLVIIDKQGTPLRPSIIWCDGRAVETGRETFEALGSERCLSSLLNSPGNFTLSKLKWVKENEPDVYSKIHKMMLPGDYIAMKLTGRAATTASGLSEGIMWDFENSRPAEFLFDQMGIDQKLVADIVPTFGIQGELSAEAAEDTGLAQGTPVSYRAGDQPNNALSLNVLAPGEIAATAGTSGVVYGVSDAVKYDPLSRVNTFLHVNSSAREQRLGILLCINGTGIANSWMKKLAAQGISYEEMNTAAASIAPGSDGLIALPFGNAAERMLENQDTGAWFGNINFNRHTNAHMYRAVQEGIAFSFAYGMDIMAEIEMKPSVIRAGQANMFLSPVFRQTIANLSGVGIELYNTDGAMGAARGAAYGAGLVPSLASAFDGLRKEEIVEPDNTAKTALDEAYGRWRHALDKFLHH